MSRTRTNGTKTSSGRRPIKVTLSAPQAAALIAAANWVLNHPTDVPWDGDQLRSLATGKDRFETAAIQAWFNG